MLHKHLSHLKITAGKEVQRVCRSKHLGVRSGADDGLGQGRDAALGEVVERRVRLVRLLREQKPIQSTNRGKTTRTV